MPVLDYSTTQSTFPANQLAELQKGFAGRVPTVPTAVAGANAGTTPPAPVVVINSNDTAGQITFGTGTTPAAGTEVVVTFTTPYATAPSVILSAVNSATAALTPYVASISTTGFSINLVGAPAASQAASFYSVNYRVN